MTTIASLPPIVTSPNGDNRFQLLEQEIHNRLRENGRSQLQNVVCFCDEDQCILTGQLPTFFLKQVAQTIAMQVEGVGKIENRIEVFDVNASNGALGQENIQRQDGPQSKL